MTHKHYTSIETQVLKTIEQGKVAMRPRWHFALKAALGIAGAALVFLAALSLLSFLIFALHASGIWFVPAFGLRGVALFLFSLPWLPVVLSLLCVFCLELLMRRYAFTYRKPLLYSIAGIVALVIAGSAAVESLRLHERVWTGIQEHALPFLGPLYRGYANPHQRGVHPVVISSTTEQGFLAIDRDGDTVEVIISPETRLPLGFDFFEGDEAVILGERTDGIIEATGIAPMHRRHMTVVQTRPSPSGP